MGDPFIDDAVVRHSKQALAQAGMKVIKHDVVLATKEEAQSAFKKMKSDDQVDMVVLFSGTWVWAAHLVGAIRDFVACGKAVLLWTHPGSQGWRPVGGLVMHGGLLEIGVPHKFVYGEADDPGTILKIISYARAAHLKNSLNMSTMGTFGGRGMGQTCGVGGPSPWMRMFGVDIDFVVSRGTVLIPNIRIHCEGSATPQVWPMPRPPKVPIVDMFSEFFSLAARA